MPSSISSSLTATAVPPDLAHGAQDQACPRTATARAARSRASARPPTARRARRRLRTRARSARSRATWTATSRGIGSLDPAERVQVSQERAPHPDQAGAAAGRIEDDVRKPPSDLLGDLVAQGLLALEPERLAERRDVPPLGRRRPRRERACRHRRSCPAPARTSAPNAARLEHERLGRVLRHGDPAAQPRGRGIGGGRAARVAGRRQRDRRACPNASAPLTASASPRALNDWVGLPASSLSHSAGEPERRPRAAAAAAAACRPRPAAPGQSAANGSTARSATDRCRSGRVARGGRSRAIAARS